MKAIRVVEDFLTKRRIDSPPDFYYPIWKQVDRKTWTADVEALKELVRKSERTDAEIQKRMVHGYFHLQEALDGKPLSRSAARHVEWGLRPPDESERRLFGKV